MDVYFRDLHSQRLSKLAGDRNALAKSLRLKKYARLSPQAWSSYMSILAGATTTKEMCFPETVVGGLRVLSSVYRPEWGAKMMSLWELEQTGLLRVLRLPNKNGVPWRVPRRPVDGKPPISITRWTGLVSVGQTINNRQFYEVACLRLLRGVPVQAFPRAVGPPEWWTEQDFKRNGFVGEGTSYTVEVTPRRAKELQRSEELLKKSKH